MTNRNYNDPLYKDWRHKIYARDSHCCQWPGCSNKKRLNAHHIYPWAQYPGLRYHLNNGITLCHYHHDFIKNNESAYAETFLKINNQKIKKTNF